MQNTGASNAATQSYINQARANGNYLQNQDNAQVTQNQGQYNNAVNNANAQLGQANQAGQNLANFNKNYWQNFNQGVSSIGSANGYNPQALGQAVKANQLYSEAYANAPQAAQQMSNYSGATAGQVTNNLSNMAGKLQQGQAGANAMMQGETGIQANVLGAASTGMGQQETGMSNLYSGAQNTYAQAVNQMQTASQTMNNIEKLAQTQGSATATQISTYENARSNYIGAQAQMESAAAAMKQAQVQAEIAPSTIASQQSQAAINQQTLVRNYLTTNPTTTARNMANALGIPLDTAGAYLTSMFNGMRVGTPMTLGNVFSGSGTNLQGSYGGLQ